MKRPAKILAWSAAVLFGIPVAAYLGWLSGNLWDDELDPAVARILSTEAPPQLDAKNNAYFDAIGIDAPDDQDAHAWGLARFQAYLATDAGQAPTARAARKPGIDKSKLPCAKAETCLNDVAADAEAARRILEAEAIVLRRLDAVLDARYQEPDRKLNYRSEFASLGPAMTAQKLAQARVALLAAEGRHEEALRQWGRLTEFAARQAAGSWSLLAKVIAIAALHRQHVLLAEYLKAYPEAAQANAGRILDMLRPLSRAELTLAPALQSEIAMTVRSFAADDGLNPLTGADVAMPAVLAVLLDPFFKRTATMNEVAGETLEWVRLDALEGGAYRAMRSALAARRGGDGSFLHYRNPIGRVLAAVGGPDFSSYFYRRDSLAAERRLLRFGVGLVADRNCDAAFVKAAVAEHPELLHPYTGALPAWTDERRSLTYAAPEDMRGSAGIAPFELALPRAGFCTGKT